MSENLLSFGGSEEFRKKLVAKNLTPYKVVGGYSPASNPQNFEFTLSDITPTDTPNISDNIIGDPYNTTYVNVYQAPQNIDGGQVISNNASSVSMQDAGNTSVQLLGGVQEKSYDTSSAKLDLINEFFIDGSAVVNRYLPDGASYSDIFVATENILAKNLKSGPYPYFQVENVFLPDIISGGFDVSSDSYLQQISTKYLYEAFQERIAREVEKYTVGKVNLQAFTDPFTVALLASGQQPLIYKNYTITVPDGIFDQAKFLAQRFSGTYIPTSPIEGDYFSEPQRQKTKAGQLIQSIGNKFYKPADPNNNPSIKFLNNTGSGQKNVLFTNLGYNRFKPEYQQNTTQVGLVVNNLFNRDTSLTNYYVGTETNDPSKVTSPTIDSPIDAYNNQTNTIVYGPDVLSKLYESDSINNAKFGLNTNNITDQKGFDGGFTWVSSKNSSEAGFFVGQGGDLIGQYSNFQPIAGPYGRSESTNYELKAGSILDETQRIIESAPTKGASRLRHVGNAINQVSKVFNDGYKELTKGSKVMKYVNSSGREVGAEYCRLFAKDRPYYSYQDLQSTVASDNGLETNGNIRKFTNSVLDSTYNLNIAPFAGQGSTNIKDGKVKKYMFSIENLAWKNSPEYESLPDCEKGPNGGRIMWFPPYNLTFSDSSTPRFKATSFLGRPEPIYTYENTERSGSISFDIIVDHPSILNLIVKNELSKENGQTVNQVVSSFFAGCKKYDIYELAKKYNTLNMATIDEAYQAILQSNQTTTEEKKQALNGAGPLGNQLPSTDNQTSIDINYSNYAFYFDDFTLSNSGNDFETLLISYTDPIRQDAYLTQNQNPEDFDKISSFFDIISSNADVASQVRNKVTEILLENKSTVKIILNGTITPNLNASSQANSKTWLESVIKYFTTPQLKKYIDEKKLLIVGEELGTETFATPVSSSETFDIFDCAAGTNDSTEYSLISMACRALRFKDISIQPLPPEPVGGSITDPDAIPNQETLIGLKPTGQQNLQSKLQGISKKILRELLTECNYFEVLKGSDPFIFDSIKEKIKFFNPVFHAITPEGLNARLTFLNQCVRPGRTMPTKQQDGSSVVTDSFNTNFGTPPILVLRIGDYYNTKIVPGSLGITYEPLFDLNPEGIGVQPMIAKITIGFSMIGGHGLAGPVDKLQNALSFNFYANTEMYDERADATESTEAVDNALIEAIRNEEPLATIKDVNNAQVNDGGKVFGNIVNSTPSQNGAQTGTIEYKTLFNDLISGTQAYFNSVTNSSLSIVQEYNLGVLQQIGTTVNYGSGFINNLAEPTNNSVSIVGKYTDWESRIQNVGTQLTDDVESSNDTLIKAIYDNPIPNSDRKKIKANYLSLITDKVSNGFNSVSTNIQSLSDNQLKYVQTLFKMDFISFSGDGKILNDGNAKIYVLSGKTEDGSDSLNQLVTDYKYVMSLVTSFYNISFNTTIFKLNPPSTVFSAVTTSIYSDSDKRVYTLFSNDILDDNKLQDFKNKLLVNVESNSVALATNIINSVTTNWKTIFKTEKDEELKKINDFIQSQQYSEYSNFNPQINGVSLSTRARNMDFITTGGSDTQKSEIKKFYSTQNSNNDNTIFNGKKQFNG